MREFHAKYKPAIRVFLDYQDVTDRAYYACVPDEPGVIGEGEIRMYTTWPPIKNAEHTDLLKECKTGKVYWIPKAEL